MDKKKFLWLAITASAGTLALLGGIPLGKTQPFLLAGLLVLCAIGLYLMQVFLMADRNWLDLRAVFTGVWLGTIGLAALGLTDYQKVWLPKTWALMATAYLMLQIGVTLGLALGPAVCRWLKALVGKAKLGRLRLRLQPNRLFGICVVTTVIGLGCFCANVAIKGYIPAFSDIVNAYVHFYTKFHIFAVASVAAAPLCYYCIVTQKLSIFKKIILGVCLFYLVFAFPILVVSRGTFVVAALGVSVCAYYLHGKRLTAFILCLVIIGAGYMLASELRNYTDAQLQIYFEPKEIELPGSSEDPTDASDATGEVDYDTDTPGKTFVLPPKVAFVYSYITVSHDNFNEAVMHVKEHSLGARQAAPFNAILRSQRITQKAADTPYYQVTQFLNTVNVIGDFYYDFGGWGVAICMLLWSVVFGLIQALYDRSKNIFSLLILGNTMAPVALCFFSAWMSVFSHWLIWGVALILAFAAYITAIPKEQK